MVVADYGSEGWGFEFLRARSGNTSNPISVFDAGIERVSGRPHPADVERRIKTEHQTSERIALIGPQLSRNSFEVCAQRAQIDKRPLIHRQPRCDDAVGQPIRPRPQESKSARRIVRVNCYMKGTGSIRPREL